MRILHVVSGLSVKEGGVSAAVAGIALTQVATGASVKVVCTGQIESPAQLSQTFHLTESDIEHLGKGHGPTRWLPRMQAQLRPLVRQADVVHVHGLWEEIQYAALRTSIQQGKRVFVSPHGMLDPWSLKQSRVRKRVYLRFRLRDLLRETFSLHATAALEAENLRQHGFGPPIATVPLGLSREEFEPLPRPGEFYAEFPQLDNRPYILFLSRLHPKKGLDVLLAAYAAAGFSPDVQLVLAGPCSAPYKRELCALIESCKLTQSVHFTGMLYGRQRLAALVDAELFVLPSRQENFAIAVAEAMATATPVVVSDQVGLAQEVQQSGGGMVTSLDPRSVCAALSRMMSDRSLRIRAGQRGRALVEKSFFWDLIARRWIELYQHRDPNSSMRPADQLSSEIGKAA